MNNVGHTRSEFISWTQACMPEDTTAMPHIDGEDYYIAIRDRQGNERMRVHIDDDGRISVSIYRESQTFIINSRDELRSTMHSLMGLPILRADP